MSENSKLPAFGLIVALGLVISTYLVTDVIRDVRLSHQIIKVRGYAEKVVKSDTAVWQLTIHAKGKNVQQAFAQTEKDKQLILKHLADAGISADEISYPAVSIHEWKKRNAKGVETSELDYYQVLVPMLVTSNKVHKIQELSMTLNKLISAGVSVESSAPQYLFTRANELKTELLTLATKDAQGRASILAEGSGVELGPLRAARQGNFSIRSALSSNVSYEQSYDDTSSIDKIITAVVTVDYAMK